MLSKVTLPIEYWAHTFVYYPGDVEWPSYVRVDHTTGLCCFQSKPPFSLRTFEQYLATSVARILADAYPRNEYRLLEGDEAAKAASLFGDVQPSTPTPNRTHSPTSIR